jgi:hypothetical protein
MAFRHLYHNITNIEIMLYHITQMENENKNDDELLRREEELERDLERQYEIEEERELVRRDQEQEDQERDLERQEELDQEYGDGYKCMCFCGDNEEQELER